MFWHNLSLAVQGWDTLGCIYSVAIQFAECNSLPKTQLPGFPMGKSHHESYSNHFGHPKEIQIHPFVYLEVHLLS